MKISNKQTEKEQKFLREIMASNPKNKQDLMAIKRKLAKKFQASIPKNSDLLKEYFKTENIESKEKFNKNLKDVFKKRTIRTSSGVAPIAILTKPYPCPGNCAYCPNEKNIPRSYLSNEPAVMRALRCKFNPFEQVRDRIKALEANGHNPEKIELIIIGGTWSYLPIKYKYWYIIRCFQGANNYNQVRKSKVHKVKSNTDLKILKKILTKEQSKNEKAKYKIIGLTLETRPDYINQKELEEMRQLGCTRVELGVQAIDDKILKKNNRGHQVKEIIEATKLLKNFGFKITYHFMPALPGSTPKKDLKMFKEMFADYSENENKKLIQNNFSPDQIKFYPTVVTEGSLLYKWWKKGDYKPYSEKELENLIIECKKIIPPYVRIIRLIRDIPGESIVAGNKITNLRQVLKQKGVVCRCIRCREPQIAGDYQVTISKGIQLKIRKYLASDGEEYFISFENLDEKIIFGFCRLRLPEKINKNLPSFFKNSALIRELHVYGNLVPVGGEKSIQHSGLGKKLVAEAEKIAQNKKYNKIIIISGVGVRGYYKKLGYKLHKTYMIKKINGDN
jgi:elongator complex protein 3